MDGANRMDGHSAIIKMQSPAHTCDSFQLRTQKLEEIVNNFHHLNQLSAHICHIVAAGEQSGLAELQRASRPDDSIFSRTCKCQQTQAFRKALAEVSRLKASVT